jgi:hypothetical protein
LVIGDETESSTRLFIRRHSFVFSTTVNSFILNPLMGNIVHKDLTFERQDRQAKGARNCREVSLQAEVIAGYRTGYNCVFNPGYDPENIRP